VGLLLLLLPFFSASGTIALSEGLMARGMKGNLVTLLFASNDPTEGGRSSETTTAAAARNKLN
jgi:hypothetical protein